MEHKQLSEIVDSESNKFKFKPGKGIVCKYRIQEIIFKEVASLFRYVERIDRKTGEILSKTYYF
jgi:hypothetical protein